MEDDPIATPILTKARTEGFQEGFGQGVQMAEVESYNEGYRAGRDGQPKRINWFIFGVIVGNVMLGVITL